MQFQFLIVLVSFFFSQSLAWSAGAGSCDNGGGTMIEKMGDGGYSTTLSSSEIVTGTSVEIVVKSETKTISGLNFWCEDEEANRHGTFTTTQQLKENANTCAGPGQTITQNADFVAANHASAMFTMTFENPSNTSDLSVTCNCVAVNHDNEWFILEGKSLLVKIASEEPSTESSTKASTEGTAQEGTTKADSNSSSNVLLFSSGLLIAALVL